MNPFYYSRRFFTRKQIKQIIFVLIFSLAQQTVSFVGLPIVNIAKADNDSALITPNTSDSSPDTLDATTTPAIDTDSKIIKKVVRSSKIRRISAYNVGDIYQTDDSPCLAANGENICEAIELGYKRCAANFVPFGTILAIEGYGECLVVDRMNSRYPNNVDIAMKKEEKAKARQFGRRSLKVTIIDQIEISPELAIK